MNNSRIPHAVKQRGYSTDKIAMIQSKAAIYEGRGRPPVALAWAAKCIILMQDDDTTRVCRYYRGLNTLMEPDSEGLGGIASIVSGMRSSTCFTSIDLTSVFAQLEFAEHVFSCWSFCARL